jgi:hypothetical protein
MTTAEQHANIARQILEMEEMTLNQLREKWVEVWNEPCRSRNKAHLKKRIAWRMQALVFGGISQRALDRARELADETFLKIKETAPETKAVSCPFRPSDDARLPIPGAVLTRVYNGRRIIVTVLDDGFEWDGQKYRSLSAVAKAVTGVHWNGFLFFGIQRKGKEAAA